MALAADASAFIDSLTTAEIVALGYDWSLHRRHTQGLPDGAWNIWLIMTGRAWGKTRTGAESIRELVNRRHVKHIHLIGRTAADARKVMVEGESGLLSCCAGDIGNVPRYVGNQSVVIWPNGAKAHLFSAEEPESLRGPQCEAFWADEVGAWKYPQDTWDNAMLGCRLHKRSPWAIVTSTPRPTGLVKALIKAAKDKPGEVVLTRGHTNENTALSASTVQYYIDKYGGTRLGRQELAGELLDDNPNALWQRAWIEDARVEKAPDLKRIVVAIDPNAVSTADNSAAGIVIAGVGYGSPANYYVLDDCTVEQATPQEWGLAAKRAYERRCADRIVAEVNQGGEMVAHVLRSVDPSLPVKTVHASRGKVIRAEPISALYEQGRVHHVGAFPALEDEMCEWQPGEPSPNRMDALVWALTELSGPSGGAAVIDFNVFPEF